MEMRQYLIYIYMLMLSIPMQTPTIIIGKVTCQCIRRKNPDGSFYIKISNPNQEIFHYQIATRDGNQNPYWNLISELFANQFTFIFDSTRFHEYRKIILDLNEDTLQNASTNFEKSKITIQKTLFKTESKSMKTTLNSELNNFNNIIQTNIIGHVESYPNLETGLHEMLKEKVKSINRAQIQNDNFAYLLTNNDIMLITNSITEKLNNPQNYPISNLSDPAVNHIKNQVIQDELSNLFFAQRNELLDLSQDNLVSKEFRFIYQNIQNLGAACGVTVTPLDSWTTKSKDFLFNRYTGALMGVGALGLILSKWGLPQVRFPSANTPNNAPTNPSSSGGQ